MMSLCVWRLIYTITCKHATTFCANFRANYDVIVEIELKLASLQKTVGRYGWFNL